MVAWRFDEKDLLLVIVRELSARGVDLDQIDVRLSEIGPVDLDLLRECFREIVAAPSGQEAALAVVRAA
jgi:hypothetical protein